MRLVTVAVVGAGSRGTGYARWILEHRDLAAVVAVAEPHATRRASLAAEHGIPAENAVEDWRRLAERGRIADAVLICTQDRMHLEPVLAFAALGYHILLEKPMAPDEASCRAIVDAVEAADVILAVGHVLRYTPYTRALKAILDASRIGEIISVQHLEPVGYWHQAHSFVRGNWRRSDLSTSMLMAKACHDLDWLQYILGQPPSRVSSFGRLSHFTPANRPAQAADRCVDCALQDDCAYAATRFYAKELAEGRHGWPLSVVIEQPTEAALDQALREGPYGRCVYACDNDAVDHQVVAMEFASGATATFTMTAFTEMGDRRTRIFGTRGELHGDGETIRVYDFRTGEWQTVDSGARAAMSAAEGHGGGDAELMRAFVRAVATGDRTLVSSGARESLRSHLAVLAAERSRFAGTVETVTD
jgi:predicted dehydrogenase